MSRHPAPDLPKWLDAMVPWTRYRLAVDGHHLHVMETGEGRPVVLLHGNPTWGLLYRRIVERLNGEPLRLIMPDLVGLGFSDKPRDAAVHTLENHARWIGGVLDQLDLADVIFVGQDWGGAIGLLALSARPGLMTGVVLLNTVIGPPKPGFKPTLFHRFSRAPLISTAVFKGLGFPQLHLGPVQGDRKSVAGRIGRAYRYPLRRFRDRVAPLALARMVPDRMEHPSVEPLGRVQAFVEAFTGPAELVWGTRDPILGRLMNRVARSLPHARTTTTEAGHFLQEEVPDTIAEAIRRVVRA